VGIPQWVIQLTQIPQNIVKSSTGDLKTCKRKILRSKTHNNKIIWRTTKTRLPEQIFIFSFLICNTNTNSNMYTLLEI